MKTVHIKLEIFEGPLELLYHLIEKNEIDIYDIPINTLTEQYLEYIEHFRSASMDSMSEFLVMAATLLEIKAKMLLPSEKPEPDEQEDPRETLVRQLLEYKKFKDIVPFLKEKENPWRYFKKSDSILIDQSIDQKNEEVVSEVLSGITLDMLHKAFLEVMKRKELRTDPIRSSFGSVHRDMYTIQDKMEYIKSLLVLNKELVFKDIFRKNSGKIEKVVTFLALLELTKLNHISVKQKNNFADIYIISSIVELERS